MTVNRYGNIVGAELFDQYGNFQGVIPGTCVADCSGPGRADGPVEYWQRELDFQVPRAKAISYLQEFGAWTVEELEGRDDIDLAQIVLWIACGDIRENGEWYGL